jgi:CxxC motif-containing protein (DUF1111 family)
LLEAIELPAAFAGSAIAPAPRGRFGWKGRFRTIDEAVAAAFANELGVLAPEFSGSTPAEISSAQIALVSDFIRQLPLPRSSLPLPSAGSRLFEAARCDACHPPTLNTTPRADPGLRNRVVAAYTDLRLHDMGPAMSDGWDADGVRGAEFRTPPLWGLLQNGPPFLHDGRAETLTEAIELHGGEAADSARAFRRLPVTERQALLQFVGSL